MRKSHRRSPDLFPGQAAPGKQSSLDEARDLFEGMKGEAVRRSQLERKEGRSCGPVTRILLALTNVASLLAAATMVCGMCHFPDAPIRQRAGAYVGKGGTARTQADFEAFVRWERVMFLVFPAALLCGIALTATEERQRRKDARFKD